MAPLGQEKYLKTRAMLLVPLRQCDHTFGTVTCSRLPHPVCTVEQGLNVHIVELFPPQAGSLWVNHCHESKSAGTILGGQGGEGCLAEPKPPYILYQGRKSGFYKGPHLEVCQCFNSSALNATSGLRWDCVRQLLPPWMVTHTPPSRPPPVTFLHLSTQVLPETNNKSWSKILLKHKDLGWKM